MGYYPITQYESNLVDIYINNNKRALDYAINAIQNSEDRMEALAKMLRYFAGRYTPRDNVLIREAYLIEWLEYNWNEYREE